ncbi:MAG: TIGR03663 family protein [Methanomicrobiales archaeon]|nr:TIGR03663 family protein [Methanomicrobiales archaeon]MDD1655184.1 TIGR03663 family protein [Methanomicrobiales archaeon]
MRRAAALIPSGIRQKLSFEVLFSAIFALAVVLRFAVLDLKLFHHDEAIHAWFSYRLLHEGIWSYDPSYHGPVLYYVTAAMFRLFGESDLVGRLVPSLLGCLIILLLLPLQRHGFLGKRETLVAALFLALSPSMVYFSRFLRHDIFMLFFSMLLAVALFLYLDTGKGRYALLAALGAAGGLCSKEEFPLILAIFGLYFVYAIWKGKFRLPSEWKIHLVGAVIMVMGIMALLYSALGAHPETLTTGAQRAIEHWTAMHEQCRLCGPPYFYVILLALYELPIFLLALYGTGQFLVGETGLGYRLKRWFDRVRGGSGEPPMGELVSRSLAQMGTGIKNLKQEEFTRFCILWMVFSMAAYGYIGEKVPWLILQQLLPMAIVAVYRLTDTKTVIAVVSVIFLALCTWHVAFVPADVNEPIVQVQNSEQMREVMALIQHADRVAISSKNYWPLPWYFRGDAGKNISYFSRRVDEDILYRQPYDMIIAYDVESYASLPGYDKRTYRLNYWFSWYDIAQAKNVPLRVLEYYVKRDGKVGSMNLDIFMMVNASQAVPPAGGWSAGDFLVSPAGGS